MGRHREAGKGEIRESIRGRLLKAAALEISAYGYEGAGIDSISVSAGFGKGTIYNYFPTKRALMEALLSDFAKRHLLHLESVVLAVSDPRDRFHAFFREGFAFVRQNLTCGRVLVATLYGPDQGFRGLLSRLYDPLFHLVADRIVQPGIDAGLFRPVDTYGVAGLCMSVYLGTSAQIEDKGELPLSPELVADFLLASLEKKQRR